MAIFGHAGNVIFIIFLLQQRRIKPKLRQNCRKKGSLKISFCWQRCAEIRVT